MPTLIETITSIVVLILLYIAKVLYDQYAYHRAMRRAGCEPMAQYPHKDPFFGSDLYKIQAEGIASGRSIAMRAELFSTYGKTYVSNWNGQKVVTTMDVENTQMVLGTSPKNFIMSPLRNKIAEPFLGRGLLTRDGQVWQHARRLAMSVLAKDQAADLPSLEKHLQNMFKLIPRDGSTVDLQPLFKRLSTDRGTELILGESINSLCPDGEGSEDIEKLLALFERILRVMGDRLRLGHLRFTRGLDLQWRRDCKEAYAILDNFIDKAVARRKASKAESTNVKYILVDKYLDVTEDRVEIQTQLVNVFLAGRDQIGISLSLLLFALARHPDVWKKLREEAMATPSPLTIERVKALQYTRNVIFEGFRLYSPVLRNIRHCDTDCVLPRGGGKDGKAPVLVSRGTQVDMDLGNMHQDPDVWGSDAAEFKPERWVDRDPGWEYIPFLGGRRTCPAKDMVLTQMSYVVVRLAQEFKTLENRDPVMDLVDDVRNVRQSRNGVLVALLTE